MAPTSSTEGDSEKSNSTLPSTAPSSPPSDSWKRKQAVGDGTDFDTLEKQENEARKANDDVDQKRQGKAQRKQRKKKAETKAEREKKAQELDELLMKSAAFSDILTKKTQALGRVGTGLDGKTLGEHNLQMAKQPKCMINGTMRDYQLEGLTWMFEICSQGMSGILADEMGLGTYADSWSTICRLTSAYRENCPNYRSDRPAKRTGGISGASPDRGTPKYTFELDGRVSQMGAIDTNRHVSRFSRAAR